MFDEYKKKCESAEEAIAKTIEKAKERGLLMEFLTRREMEVMKIMSDDILWELEIKHYMENQRREGLEEGEEEGFKRGIERGEKSGLEKGLELGEKNGELKTLISLCKKGFLSLDKAIEESGLTEEEFKEKLEKL